MSRREDCWLHMLLAGAAHVSSPLQPSYVQDERHEEYALLFHLEVTLKGTLKRTLTRTLTWILKEPIKGTRKGTLDPPKKPQTQLSSMLGSLKDYGTTKKLKGHP